MYACLYVPASAAGVSQTENLLCLARQFSPVVEQTAAHTVVFSIAPLEKLFGTAHQLASEISRYGYECKLVANLAIAVNPDTALLLARNCSGVTLAAPGSEAGHLGPLPLAELFRHDPSLDPVLLELLERWGLKTCEDLSALPERGVAERLGSPGLYLRNLALGRIHRPLRTGAYPTEYEASMQLDYPVETLEPLLFLFGRMLHELCAKLRSQSQSARRLHGRLVLADVVLETEARSAPEPRRYFEWELEFPVPLDDSRAILKLLQLHLERHSPEEPVTGVALRIDPADPRRLQHGLFLPATPAPDKLQVTLSRIAGMVGDENVGSPRLLNTHRPDAFELTPLVVDPSMRLDAAAAPPPSALRLALRIFRPALSARVRLSDWRPQQVAATGVQGDVLEAAGPWRTSGEWWTASSWARDEWDVELSDGGLYRIYCETKTNEWFVQAAYD